MALVSGRYAALKLTSAFTGTPKVIPYLGSWDLTINLDTADATYFGSVWKTQIPLFQSWTASISGYLDVTTQSTFTDQNYIVDAAIEGTLIQDMRFHIGQTSSGNFWVPNYGSTFGGVCFDYTHGCYVSNYKVSASKDGIDSISFDLIGRGALIYVCGGTSGYSVLAEATVGMTTSPAT
jgi:hypothetical protein